LLSILLIVTCLSGTALAAASFSNFTKTKTYVDGQFTDVSNQWFAPYVQTAYEYGLINGKTPTTFEPQSNLKISEAIKLAACIHSIYYTGSATFTEGTPWYQQYVDYALNEGIIQAPFADYNAYATRSDFAVIFASALPDEALTALNVLGDNAIPDVSIKYTYGPAVYTLYRAGILTGSDTAGTFYPNSTITRDGVAAIAARMANPALRQKLTFTQIELTSEEIAANCSPAVFYIEVYDASGEAYACGSGFFIDSSGLAVTNFHVIVDASSAKITTKDGKTYDIAGVYDYSEENDLVLIQVKGSGFQYLRVGNSDTINAGETIYDIGYYKDAKQVTESGIVANPCFAVNDRTRILYETQSPYETIGGALVNKYGQVIGVAAGFYTSGQILYSAIPIDFIQNMDYNSTKALTEITSSQRLTVRTTARELNIPAGSSDTVTITPSSPDFNSYSYRIDNTDIASLTWQDNEDGGATLTVKGKKAGFTVITVSLFDSCGKALAAAVINVNITDETIRRSDYYNTFTSVPDFGVFAGIDTYSILMRSNGQVKYTYKAEKLTTSASSVIADYMTLLQRHGFIQSQSNLPLGTYRFRAPTNILNSSENIAITIQHFQRSTDLPEEGISITISYVVVIKMF
jgi:hypothetical protein